jgi:hypothetical protein
MLQRNPTVRSKGGHLSTLLELTIKKYSFRCLDLVEDGVLKSEMGSELISLSEAGFNISEIEYLKLVRTLAGP